MLEDVEDVEDVGFLQLITEFLRISRSAVMVHDGSHRWKNVDGRLPESLTLTLTHSPAMIPPSGCH